MINPDLFDEFSAEEQAEMSALRARVHARASRVSSPEPVAQPGLRSDEPAVLSEAKIQADEPAVLACEARLLQHLSKAKTPERSGAGGPTSPEGKAISSANSL